MSASSQILTMLVVVGALWLAAVAKGESLDGAAVFRSRCARCHGESGKTDTSAARALKVRPLFNDPELARMTPDEIVRLVKSDAKHHNVGAAAGIDDAELRAAAEFVKQLAKRH